MGSIQSVLALNPADHNNTLLWVACCPAFFGFMRCGKFTVPSKDVGDPNKHLSLSGIALDDKNCPMVVQVTIKQSETDPFRQGIDMYLRKKGKEICPVGAIIPYLMMRGKNPAPYSCLLMVCTWHGNCLPLWLHLLSSALVLTMNGVNTQLMHWCRHHGQGSRNLEYAHKNAWKRKSSAYQRYVRISRDQLASLSWQVVAKRK